jgi:Nitrile hydratase beta subunit, C-terminal
VAAKFCPDQRVRVRGAWPPGHLRTPAYCRGKMGTIERVLAAFPNPEEEAYGRAGDPKEVLYRVRFPMHEVWPDYAGPRHDCLEVEIFEHWLEEP